MSSPPNNRGSRRHTRSYSSLLQIEDNPEDVELFRLALKKSQVSVDLSVVSDGEKALSYLQGVGVHRSAKPPDLIVLDLNLPRMDGREMLAELKRCDFLKEIPVVILTTSSSPMHVRECYTLGAACYLVKPLDFDELVALLTKTFAFWIETEPPPHNS